jgi:flagellar biosynthesis GTPase FlhF
MEAVEEIFEEDLQQKRLVSRTSRKAHKTMILPSEYMNPKDRRKYKRGSKIMAYNLNEVMPYEQFRGHTEADQRRMLEHWRNEMEYSHAKINSVWGLPNSSYFNIMKAINPTITNPKILKQMADIARARSIRENFTEEERMIKDAQRAERKQNKAQIKADYELRMKQEREDALRKEEEARKMEEQRVTREAEAAERKAAREAFKAEQIRARQEESDYAEQVATLAPQSDARLASLAPPVIHTAVAQMLQPSPVPTAALGFTIGMEVEAEGAVVFDRLRRLLAFLEVDQAKYRVSINVEEIK